MGYLTPAFSGAHTWSKMLYSGSVRYAKQIIPPKRGGGVSVMRKPYFCLKFWRTKKRGGLCKTPRCCRSPQKRPSPPPGRVLVPRLHAEGGALGLGGGEARAGWGVGIKRMDGHVVAVDAGVVAGHAPRERLNKRPIVPWGGPQVEEVMVGLRRTVSAMRSDTTQGSPTRMTDLMMRTRRR